jgi:hypothetical protein
VIEGDVERHQLLSQHADPFAQEIDLLDASLGHVARRAGARRPRSDGYPPRSREPGLNGTSRFVEAGPRSATIVTPRMDSSHATPGLPERRLLTERPRSSCERVTAPVSRVMIAHSAAVEA